VLLEGGVDLPLPTDPAPELPLPDVPLPTEPAPELPLPEGEVEVPLPLPELPGVPLAEPPVRGLPWFFSSTVLSRFGVLPDVLPAVEPPKLEPLAEERVTPNALAVLLSSCPLVWIFCAR